MVEVDWSMVTPIQERIAHEIEDELGLPDDQRRKAWNEAGSYLLYHIRVVEELETIYGPDVSGRPVKAHRDAIDKRIKEIFDV